EFEVEDAFAEGEGGFVVADINGAGDQIAVNGHWAGALATGLLGAGALPAGGFVDALEGVSLVEAAGGPPAIAIAAIGGASVGDLHGIGGQFIEKAGWNGRLPEAVDAAVLRGGNAHALAAAGNADIGEAPLFFQARAAG